MKKLTKLAAVAALAATSTGAFAATNPAAAGLNSVVPDLIVSITKGNLVRISQLSDLIFPATTVAAADLTLTDNVCVYSTTGNYNVTAAGLNGAGNQLRMISGINVMNYALAFGATPLPNGINVAGFTGADQGDDLCGGGTNTSITATILQADFNGAPAGIYSDTVVLTLAPN